MLQGLGLEYLVQQGGVVFILLLLCSIISIYVIIERIIIFTLTKINYQKTAFTILAQVKNKQIDEAAQTCEEKKNIINDSFLAIIRRNSKSKDILDETTLRESSKIAMHLEKKLSILATLGSITPFVGLFGTVIGIIKTFDSISAAESYSLNVVSSGIAEALINTAAGLLVAIPAVIAYNYFTNRVQVFIKNYEIIAAEMIEAILE